MADDTPRYRLQIVDSLAEVAPTDWDDLAAGAGCLLRHAFLHGLETTGCVGEGTGWLPRHLLLRNEADNALVGAVPLYLKGHSYGEYVFDWAWAEAYERHGLRYYPKWLSAIPFTPVSGARLLARDAATLAALARALPAIAEESQLSSVHVLFPREDEARALADAGCMLRADTQFHWRNAGWQSFEDFLASLAQSKRKKIRAERRKVHEAGVTTRVLTGEQITPEHWAFFYSCHAATYRLRGNDPYLTPAFFNHLGQTLPEHCVMALAEQDGQQIAACLLLSDILDGERRLYGRYWGAVTDVPCLHFELSYYTPIDWAIAQGVSVIEGGAQGEHKLARGFLPVPTRSAHWLAHPAFAEAVEDFLKRESRGVKAYVDELGEHSPFRRGG